MALNTNISDLDYNVALKRCVDASEDSLRVNLSTSAGMAIEISAADGDNVMALGSTDGTTGGTLKVLKVDSDGTAVQRAGATSAKASITNASTGVIIAAFSCVGMKSFNLVTKTTTNITGSQALTIEISPHDSDDVWVATSITATPGATAGDIVSGTAASLVARRARVSIAAAITTGTADVYLVAQGV